MVSPRSVESVRGTVGIYIQKVSEAKARVLFCYACVVWGQKPHEGLTRAGWA